MQIQKHPLPLSPSLFPSKTSLKLNPKSWTWNIPKRVSTPKIGGLVVVKANSEGEAKTDEFYMRRGVELARTAIGFTSPNPMVGCVIVNDGQIVGQGFHPKPGQPHAEVFALRDAGDLAENATAYVTLEPCNHYGRTPPCTEALIKAKVKKVVVGMVDPNPIVASKGVDRLRGSGIEVQVGVEEELCKRLNEAYIHTMLTGKPFVTLRYTLSINGHVLNQLGERAMECGGYYSKLLQEYDAVITSVSLAEKHSIPASQEPGANQPLSIIVARGPGSSIKIPFLTEESASRVVIFTDEETTLQPEIVQKGFETVVLERMNLGAILEYCRQRGLCSVLLDLRGSFNDFEELLLDGIEQNNLQKIVVEMLPFWGEFDEGISLGALNGIEKRIKVKNLQPKNLDQGIIFEGYL